MASSNYIYEPTVGEMNADNMVYTYAKNYDTVNNAATTGNTYKFKSDRERMQALIGSKGNSRHSGYYDGLYVRFYPITVLSPTLPSQTVGDGWGTEIGTPGSLTTINFDNNFLLKRAAGRGFYVGCSINGYIYTPVATTCQVQTTSDDGSVVFVNGTRVLNNWFYQGDATVTSGSFNLNAGYNAITINYFNGTLTATMRFAINIGNKGFTNDLSCICYYNYNQL